MGINIAFNITSSTHIRAFNILGTTILPALCRKLAAILLITINGMVMANIKKYALESFHRASSPPSHLGKGLEIATPSSISSSEIISAVINPCFETRLASGASSAPMHCATCTEKPITTALLTPLITQVLVDTKPIDAEAFAPSLPTIAESIYCIATVVICVSIAGTLSFHTLDIWGRRSEIKLAAFIYTYYRFL